MQVYSTVEKDAQMNRTAQGIRVMYQSIPKPLPSISLTVSSAQWGIWTKMRPCGAFGFRVKTSVSYKKQKDFEILWFSTCAALTGHYSCRFHMGFSVFVVHYIVISWNMSFLKVWSEDKLNKKFVVAEIFAELFSKAIQFIFVYFMSAWRDRVLHGTSDLED